MRYQNINLKNKKKISGATVAAVQYDETTGELPEIVAKGKGKIAEKIIKMAEEEGIPMQEDSSLIGSLIDMDLGEHIPPQLYSVIAEILLMLEEMEKNL